LRRTCGRVRFWSSARMFVRLALSLLCTGLLWHPGMRLIPRPHLHAHFNVNFHAISSREDWESGDRGVGSGYSLSKLTFVRAQDLCINVPSILPICVCSFQMCITTTTTTLRCVFFLLFFTFLVLLLVVSIENATETDVASSRQSW